MLTREEKQAARDQAQYVSFETNYGRTAYWGYKGNI